MSIKNHFKATLLTLASVTTLGIFIAPAASAATGTMYLDPTTTSVTGGQNVTETIYINTGASEADTVNVDVQYDTSKLQYVSYSTTGSVFGLFPNTFSNSGGDVKWVGTYLGNSTTGKQLVGTITFKALVSSGSTDLTMLGSNIVRAGKTFDPSLTGSTVSFTASQQSKPSHNSGVSENRTNSGTQNADLASNPTTPKKVSANVTLTAIDVQYTKAILHLKGQSATSAKVSYGVSKADLRRSAKTEKLVKQYDVTLNKLLPATRYFYKVVTTDKSGDTTVGSIQTFTTKGFDVAITVRDENGQLLKNKTVVIDSPDAQRVVTDNRGVANFSNITPGLHEISYTTDGQTYIGRVTVGDNTRQKGDQQIAPIQKLSVTLPFAMPTSSYTIWIIVAIVVVIVALLLVFKKQLSRVFRRK